MTALSRTADLQPSRGLQARRMAASTGRAAASGGRDQWQLWAVSVCECRLTLTRCCEAEIGSFEPDSAIAFFVLHAHAADNSLHWYPHQCCHAAEEPAIHLRRSDHEGSNSQVAGHYCRSPQTQNLDIHVENFGMAKRQVEVFQGRKRTPCELSKRPFRQRKSRQLTQMTAQNPLYQPAKIIGPVLTVLSTQR